MWNLSDLFDPGWVKDNDVDIGKKLELWLQNYMHIYHFLVIQVKI